MKQLKILLLFKILFCFSACEQDEVLPTNERLIFPYAQEFFINTSIDEEGFPIFDLTANTSKLLYIGIFEDSVTLNDARTNITNADDIIWYWNTGLGARTTISVTDGIFQDTTYLPEKIICQSGKKLYWAAWAWNEDGTKVAYSTSLQEITLKTNRLPNLKIQQVNVITQEKEDGYILAGEEITIKYILENVGNRNAEQVYASLSNLSIFELPQQQVITEIAPNGTGEVFFKFRIPQDITFQESIILSLKLTYNSCLEEDVYQYAIKITGQKACLLRVVLVEVKSKPSNEALYWDSIWQIGFWNPDPIFVLFEEGNDDALFISEILQEVPPNNPDSRKWSPLNPCKSIQLDKLYTIEVYDKDTTIGGLIDNADDFMGDIKFYPRDFLDTIKTVYVLESETLLLQVELEWQ